MSFAATTTQVIERSKTVTRRTGWHNLTAGTRLWAVERAQGLARGEHHNRLALIEVTNVRREPLDAITTNDVAAEGFPDQTPEWFIDLYLALNGGTRDQLVTRIEFAYLDPGEANT